MNGGKTGARMQPRAEKLSPAPLKGPIAYMAGHHVAASILMLIFIVGGLIIGGSIKQEVFPEFELDMVSVTVAYPGATPSEVEDAIIRPIEFALSGVDNIKRMNATATEGIGTIVLEVMEGGDVGQVVQDAKAEVDRILTFPEEAEKPVVSKPTNRREVISLIVYGDASERALREQAERIRDDLLVMPNITQVEIAASRPYEISIEIPEENLRKYNLTLARVAAIIRGASLDLAGGSIKAAGGEVLIRTTEKRHTGVEYDSVAVFTHPNGRRVLLGEIAEVRDGFAELDQATLLDGKPAVIVRTFRVGNQRPADISKTVRQYIEERNRELPPSLRLAVYKDMADLLAQRLGLLMKNGAIGLVLVLIILSLFLEIRLAIWVALGIVISFLGSLIAMPSLGISINMVSLFAFLTMLGVVVDDAIVVGENIHVHQRRGKSLLQAAVDGTREVSTAVVFAGVTTVCAFGVLLLIGGFIGKMAGAIPKIVIAVLAVSLIESLFILPSHLSGGVIRSRSRIWDRIEAQRSKVDRILDWFVNEIYGGALDWARRNRYTTFAIAVALLLTTLGIFRAGLIKFVFFPEIEADEVKVTLRMPPGTPFEETCARALRIQRVGEELIREYDAERGDEQSNLRHSLLLLGQELTGGGPAHNKGTVFSSNIAQVRFMLDAPDERSVSTSELAARWREEVGEIPGADQLTFQSDLIRAGGDIELELSHADYGMLLAAVERLKNVLSSYAGVEEVTDTHREGKKEMRLRLRPEASSLGITERDLAMQTRSAFYGAEALRIQRGQNEVKVMVRYPERDRRTMAIMDRMRIRTPRGGEVPFSQAAYVEEGRGFSSIKRTDRRRVVNVTARVDKAIANATEILAELEQGILQALVADYPGLTYKLEGASRDQAESVASLRGALAFGLFLIFAALAVPFRSFLQPLVVMSVIPFGMVGALIGHLLFGYNLSMMSLFGMVALSGVVVNDSLVMIDFINRARREGMPLRDAIMKSGKRRFRPIIMTSLTTFFGLAPMILETSIQARFLVPIALSLGFGILFATAITLLLVPTLYLILEDILGLFRREAREEGRERREGMPQEIAT